MHGVIKELKEYRAPLKTSAIYLHYAFCRHIAQNFFGIRQYACKNFVQSADKIRSTSKRHRFLEMPYKLLKEEAEARIAELEIIIKDEMKSQELEKW